MNTMWRSSGPSKCWPRRLIASSIHKITWCRCTPRPSFRHDGRSGPMQVDPTCETGRRYGIELLNSCDGTVGWTSLLPIVADMIRAGTNGAFADGHPKVNGIVI